MSSNVTTLKDIDDDDSHHLHHDSFMASNTKRVTRSNRKGERATTLKTQNGGSFSTFLFKTLLTTPTTSVSEEIGRKPTKVKSDTNIPTKQNVTTQVKLQRSIRTTLDSSSSSVAGSTELLTRDGRGGMVITRGGPKRRRILPAFASQSSSSSSGFRLIKLPTPALLTAGEPHDRGQRRGDKYNNYIPHPDDVHNGDEDKDRDGGRGGGDDDDDDIISTSAGGGKGGKGVVSRRLLDIHQISSRLHRSFPWEGLGLHGNYNSTHWSGFITNRIGALRPAEAPHTLVFSSFYIVPLILLLGVVIALIWLLCACIFHTMNKIKLALCPGRLRDRPDGSSPSSKKGKKSNNHGSNKKKDGSGGGGCSIEEKPQILTPEILEMRRQERLAFLQAECANLEQQLTGLRASLQQSTFEEKATTLTSRASDSDLEYLGASESPPLKRNSISLQDIPQSVIRIRREKELRQIKEEIEYLKTIAQEEKEKAAAQAARFGLKGSILLTQDFELPGSKPASPNESKVEPLSQHISHLKTQRKLNEIRTELEDLAIQLLHPDEIKAKRCSLQELPRTALNIQREQNLITMTNELQKKNYKLQQKNVIETALEKTTYQSDDKSKKSATAGSKSFKHNTKESPSTTEDAAAKYSDPEFVHRASIKRHREQELNRVRVELKDLAYKLNLNPMNYISEDRVRLVPSQSMQSTSSITGGGGSGGQSHKSTSSSSALNHV